jgi:hypothetical protein
MVGFCVWLQPAHMATRRTLTHRALDVAHDETGLIIEKARAHLRHLHAICTCCTFGRKVTWLARCGPRRRRASYMLATLLRLRLWCRRGSTTVTTCIYIRGCL